MRQASDDVGNAAGRTRGRRRLSWLATALFPAWWIGLVISMRSAYQSAVVGPRGAYGGYAERLAGQISSEAAIGGVEAAFLLLVLQPWSERPIWPRALIALLLFFPWTLLAFAMGMHAGPVNSAHTDWRLMAVASLAVVTVASGFRAIIRRRAHDEPSPG